MARQLTRADILPIEQYAPKRWEYRKKLTDMRRLRRIEVGPHITFSFECWDTMWHQVQEMLYIEKGGEEQLADELAAYNPLIPNGSELVATVMIEIDDPGVRARELMKLGGIDEAIEFRVGGAVAKSRPEKDQERTKDDGKTSSVHFIHFPFDAAGIAAFKKDGAEVMLAITHPAYRHIAVLPEDVRKTLAGDFSA